MSRKMLARSRTVKDFGYCERDKWKSNSCKSNLNQSKDMLIKRRFCRYRTHKTANCKGPYYMICDDFAIKNAKRLPKVYDQKMQ